MMMLIFELRFEHLKHIRTKCDKCFFSNNMIHVNNYTDLNRPDFEIEWKRNMDYMESRFL